MLIEPMPPSIYEEVLLGRYRRAELAVSAASTPDEVRRVIREFYEGMEPYVAAAARWVALHPPAPLMVKVNPGDADRILAELGLQPNASADTCQTERLTAKDE